MRNRTLALMVATAAVVGLGFAASAQQKPATSRTPITVYKSPT
jgi:hypothetical protein